MSALDWHLLQSLTSILAWPWWRRLGRNSTKQPSRGWVIKAWRKLLKTCSWSKAYISTRIIDLCWRLASEHIRWTRWSLPYAHQINLEDLQCKSWSRDPEIQRRQYESLCYPQNAVNTALRKRIESCFLQPNANQIATKQVRVPPQDKYERCDIQIYIEYTWTFRLRPTHNS